MNARLDTQAEWCSIRRLNYKDTLRTPEARKLSRELDEANRLAWCRLNAEEWQALTQGKAAG